MTDPDDFRMSLLSHLSELRSRLLRVVIAVLVLGIAALVFAKSLYGFLMQPVLTALPPDASSLVFTSAIEEFNVYMKVGLYAGVFLSTPVLLFEIWGFVAPGLYENERKLASPFIIFGTLAFIGGATFCYLAVLPSMFKFLLRDERTIALEARLQVARLQEEEALHYLRLNDASGVVSATQAVLAELEKPGDGQVQANGGGLFSWEFKVPKRRLAFEERMKGMGRIIDAISPTLDEGGRARLRPVMALRQQAIESVARDDFGVADEKLDEAALTLGGAGFEGHAEIKRVWQMERALSVARSEFEASSWTKPMLSMNEQLSLVLILLLAFGLIFEMPLVMAVLSLAGLVKASFLFKYQRHALVVCLIVAAIITPTGDAVNLSLMAGPMLACYELGVLLVWLIERRRGPGTPAPVE